MLREFIAAVSFSLRLKNRRQTITKADVPQDLADLQKAINAAVEAHSAQFGENVRQLTQNLEALKVEIMTGQRVQSDVWPSTQTAYG